MRLNSETHEYNKAVLKHLAIDCCEKKRELHNNGGSLGEDVTVKHPTKTSWCLLKPHFPIAELPLDIIFFLCDHSCCKLTIDLHIYNLELSKSRHNGYHACSRYVSLLTSEASPKTYNKHRHQGWQGPRHLPLHQRDRTSQAHRRSSSDPCQGLRS